MLDRVNKSYAFKRDRKIDIPKLPNAIALTPLQGIGAIRRMSTYGIFKDRELAEEMIYARAQEKELKQKWLSEHFAQDKHLRDVREEAYGIQCEPEDETIEAEANKQVRRRGGCTHQINVDVIPRSEGTFLHLLSVCVFLCVCINIMSPH